MATKIQRLILRLFKSPNEWQVLKLFPMVYVRPDSGVSPISPRAWATPHGGQWKKKKIISIDKRKKFVSIH